MRWLIVSNRLPFQKDKDTGHLSRAPGGLVTAVTGIHNDCSKIWVGIAPDGFSPTDLDQLPPDNEISYHPVFVDAELYQCYYDGFANNVLWPLFHYEGSLIQFNWDNWRAYEKVNKLIADSILAIAQADDLIWVHDFHLFLLPALLKQQNRQLKIGFFLHIPFPSSEIFRQLPVRETILTSLLQAELVGFHDYSYLRHFCNTLLNTLGLNSNMLSVTYGARTVNLGVFPVSIDTAYFIKESQSQATQAMYDQYRLQKDCPKMVLGVDRLDYTKGILLKLQAFGQLLENYPEWREQVYLLQIAIPTRPHVPAYKRLKEDVERLISDINGRFSSPTYTPIRYMFNSVDAPTLMALYQLADVLLVTSRRDGMNLVALEYIAAQAKENPGVMILSEFAGASALLSHSLFINPWDSYHTAEKIMFALSMPLTERIRRYQPMLAYLNHYTASDWARGFMNMLAETDVYQEKSLKLKKRTLLNGEWPKPFKQFMEQPVVLFVDYDGTLTPIVTDPAIAILAEDVRLVLKQLAQNPLRKVIIVSGRDRHFMTEQLADLGLPLVAEHGAQYFDPDTGDWLTRVHSDRQPWFSIALKIMEDYSSRVLGSFIEEKEFSIAWHYRESPAAFAQYQAKRLEEQLDSGLSNLPVSILSGKKVIEARAIEADKGHFIRWYTDVMLPASQVIRLVAIGDDTTDEDMFVTVQSKGGIGIKVGKEPSLAHYHINQQADVLAFLSSCANSITHLNG